MGFAVLHLDKASGNDAPMTAHIERTIEPKNADKSRTHLNRELITFPDGVSNRTSAIQHRIETAGITRKISHNQVRAIRVMLSGTHDDMKRIEEAGKLDDWCRDSLEWLRKEVENDNVVSAVLHLDEKTPHIHATVVPIVSGERRKAKTEKNAEGKKKYKKKKPNAARLCADDMTAREKLKGYQNSYAEAMAKYGLKRGVEGSEARHITTQQYYRELYDKNEHLKEDIQELQEERKDVYETVRDMYDQKDEAREKYLNMDRYVQNKTEELATIETKLQKAKQEYAQHRAQEEVNLIHKLFPMMKEQLRIAELCRKIGLAIESIKSLFEGKTSTAKTSAFFSPEHNQRFTAIDVKLKIEKEPDNPTKLRLNINGMNILEWFNMKYLEVKQNWGFNSNSEVNKNKGIRM
jgi:chromosome segregation ATPase